MNLDISQLGIDYIITVFRQYFAGIDGYLAIFILCVVIVFGIAEKKERELFVYPILALAAVVYNPLVMNLVIIKLSLSQRYYRYLWLLPIGFVIGFALVKLIGNIKGKLGKAVAMAGVLFSLFYVGNSIFPIYSPNENIYKLPQDTLELDRIITEDSKETERVCLYADGYSLQVRQYDASIISVLSRKQLLSWNIDVTNQEQVQQIIEKQYGRYILTLLVRYGQRIEPDIVKKYLEKYDVNYIIIEKQYGLDEYMKELSTDKVGETNTLDIYRVRGQ